MAELPGSGIKIQDTAGEGTTFASHPVVFLHAGSGCARMWEHQVMAFTNVGYCFICYDRPPNGDPVDDLEALAQHLGL